MAFGEELLFLHGATRGLGELHHRRSALATTMIPRAAQVTLPTDRPRLVAVNRPTARPLRVWHALQLHRSHRPVRATGSMRASTDSPSGPANHGCASRNGSRAAAASRSPRLACSDKCCHCSCSTGVRQISRSVCPIAGADDRSQIIPLQPQMLQLFPPAVCWSSCVRFGGDFGGTTAFGRYLRSDTTDCFGEVPAGVSFFSRKRDCSCMADSRCSITPYTQRCGGYIWTSLRRISSRSVTRNGKQNGRAVSRPEYSRDAKQVPRP